MSRSRRRAVLGGLSAGAAIALALALPSATAGAQQSSPPSAVPASPDEARRKLESKKGELDTTESRAQALKKDLADLSAEREKLNQRLLETAALIQKSEGQMTAIEGRLGELEVQEKMLRGSLSERHDHIAKLLAALQRMGRNPPPVMITQREDALKMVRSAMLLASAFPGMRKEALALAEKLNDLVRVMTGIREEGDKLKAETQRLSDMRTRLAGLMDAKKQSLGEKQAELAQVRAAAAEISKSVTDLSDLIQKLDQAVTNNTGLGAYEEEARRQVAQAPAPAPAAVPSPALPQPGDPAPAKDVAAAENEAKGGPAAKTPGDKPETRVVELAPAGNSLVPGSAGRIKPAIAFQLARGRLPLPAQGRRVLSFGEKTQYGGNSKGIVVETRQAAQVTAPCDGWIVYAGEFRSYGQLLIINAGGGYHVLVAGLSQIDVQPGQFVLAAEPVGTMSSAPKASQGNAQVGAPVLYIEFRKDGQPIDPDPWWVEGSQKVQG